MRSPCNILSAIAQGMSKTAKLTRPTNDQAGYALIWVSMLLIVSSLILVPLLLLMSTGIISSNTREESTHRFYAADAGIELGIWHLQKGETLVEDFVLNGSTVDVTISGPLAGNAYKITSTAIDNDAGKATTIESYASYEQYDLFDNAITSRGDVDLQPGSTVVGTIQYDPDEGTLLGDVGEAQVVEDATAGWPTNQALLECYWADVEEWVDYHGPYPSNEIDIKDLEEPREIGPLYRDGDLKIYSSENQEELEAELTGTLYVTGDLTIGQTMHEFIFDLGAQTIFVEGNIVIADKCTITGHGCFVIALGDITFMPKMQSEEGDFVFLMSVTGTVQFQPSGAFQGSVAGDVNVLLQPGSSLIHTDPPEGGLNFPAILARGETTIHNFGVDGLRLGQ